MGAMKELFMQMQEQGVTVLNNYEEMDAAVRHEHAINFLLGEIGDAMHELFMLTGMSEDELIIKANELVKEASERINL